MAKAKIIITADNQIKKGLDPATKAMLEFQTKVDNLQKKLSKAFSVAGVATAAVASFRVIKQAASECIKEYSEAERVSKRLEAVWNNVGTSTGKTAQQMDDLAEALEKQTYFSSESIKEAGLLLAATESLTEEGFDRALNASMDLAAALGEDVTAAAQTLSKAIQEPESALSRLKTIGVSFTEDEKAQIKALTDANKLYEAQALILDKVEDKYKDVSKAINQTPAGTLDNIRDTLGDIRENLGKALVNSLSPALESIYGWLTKISEWMAKVTDANSVSAMLQAGSSLAGFSDIQLQAVRRLYQDNLANPRANGRDMTSTLNKWIKAIDDELKAREGSKATFSVNTADNSIQSTAVENTLADFFKSYGKASQLYQEQGYRDVIAQAEGFLAELKNSTTSAQAEMLKEAGFSAGTSPNRVIAMIEEVLADYNDKLEGTVEPTDLEKILSSYGSKSKQWQAENLQKQIDSVMAVYDSATEGQRDILDEIVKSLSEEVDALTGIEKSVSGTFLDKFAASIADAINPYGSAGTSYSIGGASFNVSDEQANAAANKAVSILVENLGEAGDLIANLAQNMASMGPVLGAIVTAFEYVVQGFAEVFGDTLNTFVQYGLEPLRELGRVIGEVLLPLMDAIMPSVADTANFLIGVFDTLGSILQPIVHIIGMVLTPVLKAISGVLNFLLPFIKAIGNAIVAVISVIEWVVQWFQYIWGSLGNALASIHVGNWYPLAGLGGNKVSKPASLKDHIESNMADVNSSWEMSTSGSASTETALSSASYRGATQVTINIYQMSPVVGENGMREFASMIREEFEALDYYGVGA